METIKKILLLLLFVLIANALFMVLQAQSNQLPLLALNDLIEEVNDEIEEEDQENSSALEIDHILLDNDAEEITVELWSNEDGKLVSSRNCTSEDEGVFFELMNQEEGDYTLLLKSGKQIVKSYRCKVGKTIQP